MATGKDVEHVELSDKSPPPFRKTNQQVPHLTVVLFGSSSAVQFEDENILLGQEHPTLHHVDFSQVGPKHRNISNRNVSVINILSLQENEPYLDSVEQVIAGLVKNTIHVFVFVLQLRRLTDTDTVALEWLQERFGKDVLPFVMILFTYESKEQSDTIIDDLKTNPVLEQLLDKCGDRYYTCSKSMNNQSEMKTLLEKIDQLVSKNRQHCYTAEMYQTALKHRPDQKAIHSQQSVIKCIRTKDIRYQHPKDPESINIQTNAKEGLSHSNYDTMSPGGPNQAQISNIEEDHKQEKRQNVIDTSVTDLLRRLNLDNNYNKLTKASFLEITSCQEPSSEKELVLAFMQRLLTADYRERNLTIRTEPSKNETAVQQCQHEVKKGDIFNALLNKKFVSGKKKLAHIHPMDVQMAVFHCSDSFLKQLIVSKLSQCQYALPLLVPNPFTREIEFPLWTFRQIKKSWKSTDQSGNVSLKTKSICEAETPFVMFFRLGSTSSVSKSQLMNSLINEKHSTFFHRHCLGSSRNCLLMDGVVEIAWYCPSGKSTDHFTDCVAFCNLHGDSSTNGIQREILTEIASVNVALLPKLDENDNNMNIVKELCNSIIPLIILLTEEEDDEDEDAVCFIGEGKYRMSLKERSQSDVSDTLRGIIRECLSKNPKNFRLDNIRKSSKVRVDEDEKVCQDGKKKAYQIWKLLTEVELSEIKEIYLPCQGKLWHEWCQMNKNLYRLQENNLEEENTRKKSEMMRIRRKQLERPFSNLMSLFVNNLKEMDSKSKEYFLEWVVRMMDDFMSDSLSAIYQKVEEKWTEVLELKKKNNEALKLKHEQANLENTAEQLLAASFGLEHILREMGQIYEAWASVPNDIKGENTDLTHLAELGATLMILGYPLELMDGDAAHVPVIWVSSVLDHLIGKLNNPRIFVLSVLGIQSSGKSTLLNAMFGLQFAVSAGRCTKGAFMQLVKVSEHINKELNYILVVDTEGLRSSELVGQKVLCYDNELATFVVGLGNLTLINIFGENPTDMQDILQIVVQAFLRMKKVRLNPSCMFIHQNVGDITAEEKTMEARRCLQEKLDEMTKLAAKEEVCCAEYFRNVIAFDVQSDVRYFAPLWEGNPPMAPPNPSYCDNVYELKKTILHFASNSQCLTLSQIKDRVTDLWSALLTENFVFSFKNTLEIAVYRKLEEQYATWTWSLRSAMLSVQEKLHTRINNKQLTKVDDIELMEEMRDTFEKVKESMKCYFVEEREGKEMLDQWKGRFEKKIEDLHNDLIKQAKRELDDIILQKEACKKLDEQKILYEAKLFEKSKELALNLQSKVNDENELKTQFDSVWGKWVSDLAEGSPPMAEADIDQDITKILCEMHEQQLVLERLSKFNKKASEDKDSKMYKKINMRSDYTKYVNLKKLWKIPLNQALTSEDQNCIRQLVLSTIQETEKLVKSKSVAKMGYKTSYIQEIALLVKQCVAEHNSEHYELKKKFTVDLSLHVCKKSGEMFSQLHKEFRDSYNPLIYLEKKKSAYYGIFQKFCQGATTTAIFSGLICSKLEESILQSVYNRTAKYLSEEIRRNIPAFNGNRSNLEKHILKQLAEQEEFTEFQNYIVDPQTYFQSFIKDTFESFMKTENSTTLEEIRNTIAQKNHQVIDATNKVTKEVSKNKGDLQMWLEKFSDNLKDELALNKEHFSGDFYKDISDFVLLEEILTKDISVLTEQLTSDLKSLSNLKMEKFRKRPDEILIEHLCQCCWVQCPFCHAICTNTVEDHDGDHSVPFHRVPGITGTYYRGTTEFANDFCSSAVASNKRFFPDPNSNKSFLFKELKKAGGKYANWSITPDLSELPYWKWFVCRFQQDLENLHKKTFQRKGQIPAEWRKYTVKDAIASLEKYI